MGVPTCLGQSYQCCMGQKSCEQSDLSFKQTIIFHSKSINLAILPTEKINSKLI